MNTLKRKAYLLGIVIIPLLLSACFSVQIKQHVDDPSPYFKKAYRQIERIHQQYPHREGKARRIHILVYEGTSQELVKFSTVLWLVNDCIDLGRKDAEWKSCFDKKFEFDWMVIRDLGQVGPGLMMEVVDETDKVLIWLD